MPATIRRPLALFTVLLASSLLTFGLSAQQSAPAAPTVRTTPAIHAKASKRLVIRNAMVIFGNAKPPAGPMDIISEDGLISYIGPASDRSVTITRPDSDVVIDGTGKYVMPGIVNAHMHWHDERQAGMPQ